MGGFPVEEDPLADVPMLRRIALEWNIASVSKPLVRFRVHGDTASASLGSFTGLGYEADDSYARTSFRQRTGFLDEAGLPTTWTSGTGRSPKPPFGATRSPLLANRAESGGHWRSTNTELARLVRADPRTLRLPSSGGSWRRSWRATRTAFPAPIDSARCWKRAATPSDREPAKQRLTAASADSRRAPSRTRLVYWPVANAPRIPRETRLTVSNSWRRCHAVSAAK